MAFVAASVALASCSSEGSGNAASENTAADAASTNAAPVVDNGTGSGNAGGEVTSTETTDTKGADAASGNAKKEK